jgi:hypothetical protein
MRRTAAAFRTSLTLIPIVPLVAEILLAALLRRLARKRGAGKRGRSVFCPLAENAGMAPRIEAAFLDRGFIHIVVAAATLFFASPGRVIPAKPANRPTRLIPPAGFLEPLVK